MALNRAGRRLIVLMLFCTSIAVVLAGPQQAVPASRVRDAESIVDAMVKGDFAGIFARFDATMKAAVTAEALGSGWTSVGKQVGAFVRRGTAQEQTRGSLTTVVIPVEFERGKLEVTVVYNAAGEIAGLSMRSPTPPWSPPAYATPAAYTERAITIGAGEWALPGTLSVPVGAGPFPAVVLVHGSGANDRDESYGPNKTFKDLALGLSSQGVAVLRFDKRTLVYGAKLRDLTRFTVKDESIDDALAAVALLRTDPAIDKNRIFVLGHSLGGMLIPRIGAADPKIAGLIVMAGTVRPIELVIIDQYEYLFGADGTISDTEQQQIDTARKNAADIAKLTADDARAGRMISNAPASYWLDLRGYDPPSLAAKLPQRILVLQGERDYQVPVAEFDRWKAGLAAKPNAEFHLYPALNHLFLPGTGKSLPPEYNVPGHVPIEVIFDIATWVKK